MNYRKIAFILMTVGFVMIMSGSVSSFVLGLQADREETYKRIEIVNDQFDHVYVFICGISYRCIVCTQAAGRKDITVYR